MPSGLLVVACQFLTCCKFDIPLYYLPPYYAFTSDYDTTKARVHILLYIGVYIAGAFDSGNLLTMIR
jgi:hypothetical protein